MRFLPIFYLLATLYSSTTQAQTQSSDDFSNFTMVLRDCKYSKQFIPKMPVALVWQTKDEKGQVQSRTLIDPTILLKNQECKVTVQIPTRSLALVQLIHGSKGQYGALDMRLSKLALTLEDVDRIWQQRKKPTENLYYDGIIFPIWDLKTQGIP